MILEIKHYVAPWLDIEYWYVLTVIGRPRPAIKRRKQSAKPIIRARLPYH